MIPELGHFALWIALGVAAVLGVMPMLGAARGRADWMALARPSTRLLFVLVAFAFVCLAASFVGNDFSVAQRRDQLEHAPCRCSTGSPRPGAATKARSCSGC